MIELGKYALPVLASYGISGLLLAGVIVQSIIANRRARLALEAHQKNG